MNLRVSLLWLGLALGGCDPRGFWGNTFVQEDPGCDAGRERCAMASPDGAGPQCRQHEDCPSGLCRLDDDFAGAGTVDVGACFAPEQVCLVDARLCRVMDSGSKGRPYCEVGEALGHCPYIVVHARAGGAPYTALTVADGSVTLIGPGREAAAVLGGLEVSGAGTRVTVQDLVLSNPAATGVSCGKGAQLLLRRSAVRDSAIGIDADQCGALRLEAVRVEGNQGDGVHLGPGSGYSIVNSMIVRNATATGTKGIYFASMGGKFAFNTVAQNPQGGIYCDFPLDLSDSIVTGNGTGPQMEGHCRPARVVTADPGLDPQTFRLTDKSLVCIDRAQTDPAVKTDYFGILRPQRAAYDIGAHELP